MFGKIKWKKALIDRELQVYKEERLLLIDREILTKKENILTEFKKGTEQLGAYEHEFHHVKELKGIELAKLEAKIEISNEVLKAREEVIRADQNLLNSKNAEIQRLNELLTILIKESSKHGVTIQTLK